VLILSFQSAVDKANVEAVHLVQDSINE